MTRRGFVGLTALSGAAAAFDAWAIPAGAEPILRVGIMTDTHIGRTRKSCARVKLALEFFRKRNLDMILNAGDVADHHYPEGYKAYREITEEVLGDIPASARPKEVFTYAWHDAYAYRGHPRTSVLADAPAAFADMRRLLGNVNEPDCTFSLKGFPFVVVNQFCAADRIETLVSGACRENSGKPVFLVSHVPPQGTVFHSWIWGDARLPKILEKYPQIIVISGHTHGSNRCERNIWQGAYTVVNAGCLQVWSGPFASLSGGSFPDYGVLVMEASAREVVFRRYDVRTGEEYAVERPWRIPLPFDPATAPYRPEVRAREAAAPSFAAGAILTATARGTPFDGFELTFPPSAGETRPCLYRASVSRRTADGGWERFAEQEVCGDFHLLAGERPAFVACRFGDAYFRAGETYRFEVAPENFWGRSGAAISCQATAPRECPVRQKVWESADGREIALYGGERSPVELKRDAGGWYSGFPTRARVSFPKAAAAVPDGGKLRLTLDVRTRRPVPDDACLRVVMLPSKRLDGGRRILAHTSAEDLQRYVFEFTKKAGEDEVALWFDTHLPGQIKFEHAGTEVVKGT